jgi:hypothetical protein
VGHEFRVAQRCKEHTQPCCLLALAVHGGKARELAVGRFHDGIEVWTRCFFRMGGKIPKLKDLHLHRLRLCKHAEIHCRADDDVIVQIIRELL